MLLETETPYADKFFQVMRRVTYFTLGNNTGDIFKHFKQLDLITDECCRFLEAAEITVRDGRWCIGIFNEPVTICGELYPKHTHVVIQGDRPNSRVALFSVDESDIDERQTFNESLRDLLNRLDAIAPLHREITDTAVREEMAQAVLDGFFHLDKDYCYKPRKFAMFSNDGNTKIMAVLYAFISAAIEAAKREGLDTFHKRLTAFQNRSIVSDEGHAYDWYFGTWHAENFDENGERIDRR